MPSYYRKKSRVYRKRRKYARKRTGTHQLGKISKDVIMQPNLKLGYPNKLTMIHRYVHHHAVDTATNGTFWQYWINNMNDINFTGIGGPNPMFYTDMARIYNEFLVTKVKINVTCSQTSERDVLATIMFCVRDTDTISTFDIEHAIMCGNRSRMNLSYSQSGSALKTFSQIVDIKRTHGASRKLSTANGEYTAQVSTVGAGPRAPVFFTIQFFNPNTGAGDVGVSLDYTAVFDITCTWFNRKEQLSP